MQKLNYDVVLQLHVQGIKPILRTRFNRWYELIYNAESKIRTFTSTETCTSKNFSY